MKKWIQLACIAAFFGILAASLLCSDFAGGKVSETQKRTLAAFPELRGEGMTLGRFTGEFETWAGDNIGFAPQYNRLYTAFTAKTLGIMPNDKVFFGRDGFYYLTANHNVEIGKAAYFPDEDQLRVFAENQQHLSDSYKAQNRAYYLVLVPSKASVYPEYIKGGRFTVTETYNDVVEAYLLAHTDVRVINLKPALVDAKANGQVFLRTDTHWTPYGCSVACREIMDRLLADGAVERAAALDFDFTQTASIDGDLAAMIGADALEREEYRRAVWDRSVRVDTDSALAAGVRKLLDRLDDDSTLMITRDECTFRSDSADANPKTLLLYGDSLYRNSDARPISAMLAENFATTQYVRMRTVSQELDTLVDPDVVIYSSFERMAETVLRNEPAVMAEVSEPTDLSALRPLPKQTADISIGDGGLWVGGAANGVITLDSRQTRYLINGWAIDYRERADLAGLLVYADDTQLYCHYGLPGPDVQEHFGIDTLRNCRFKFFLYQDYLKANNVQTLKFVLLSADGVSYYEPIVYRIAYK